MLDIVFHDKYFVAVNKPAPAPSPKRTHVDLSCQSSNDDIFSEQTRRMVLYLPDFIILSATCAPYIKPEQIACISNEGISPRFRYP